MTDGETFYTASLAFVRDGWLLTVRKRGTERFMLPGGKIEPGESPLACALREAEEEVGAHVAEAAVGPLGHWQAAAANEPGCVVDSVVHVTSADVDPAPRAEIAEVRWIRLDDDGPDLAPLLRQHVLPALRSRSHT